MKSKIINISISIAVILISFSIFYHYVIYLPRQEKSKTNQQENSINLKDINTLSEENIQTDRSDVSNYTNKAVENESVNNNSDLILLNAKIDSQNLTKLANLALEGLNKNKKLWCESAYNSANSRDHLYYSYVDEVNRKNLEYSKYNVVFEADNNIVNMFKDECRSVGFILE